MATTISKIGIKNSTGSGYDTRDIGAKGQNIEIGYDSSGNIIEDVDKTTAATTKTLSTVLKTNATTVSNLNTTLSKKISDLDSSKAPSSHITAQADASTLGHIKIGTGLSVDGDAASSTYGQTRVNFASNGETAANKAVQANDTRLSNSRSNPNAVTFTTNAGDSAGSYNGSAAKTVGYSTVGAAPAGHPSTQATSSILGHVTAGTGLSASSGKLSVSYGTSAGTACVGNDGRLSDSRTPKSHAASTASTYGAGNASQFGHVKLTDEYNVTEPSAATNGAATSIAASAYALQQAYSTLNSNLSKFINGVNWASAGGGITTGTVNLPVPFTSCGALLIMLSKDFNIVIDTQIVPTPFIKSGKEYHLYGALSNAKLTVVASDERTLKITELTGGFTYNIYYVMSTSFSV